MAKIAPHRKVRGFRRSTYLNRVLINTHMAQAFSYRPALSATGGRWQGKKQAAVSTDMVGPTGDKHLRGHGSNLRRDGERLARANGHRVTVWQPMERDAALTASRWVGHCDFCREPIYTDPCPPKIRTSQDYTGESWANAYPEVHGPAADNVCPHAEVLDPPAPTNKTRKRQRYIKWHMSKHVG